MKLSLWRLQENFYLGIAPNDIEIRPWSRFRVNRPNRVLETTSPILILAMSSEVYIRQWKQSRKLFHPPASQSKPNSTHNRSSGYCFHPQTSDNALVEIEHLEFHSLQPHPPHSQTAPARNRLMNVKHTRLFSRLTAPSDANNYHKHISDSLREAVRWDWKVIDAGNNSERQQTDGWEKKMEIFLLMIKSEEIYVRH